MTRTPPRTDNCRWLRNVEALESVAAQLRSYLVTALLVPDQARPYVRVSLPDTCGEEIRVIAEEGRDCYLMVSRDDTHPVMDAPGCARRLATRLRREQEQQRATRMRRMTR